MLDFNHWLFQNTGYYSIKNSIQDIEKEEELIYRRQYEKYCMNYIKEHYEDDRIKTVGFCSQKPRLWAVEEIRYDYESGGWYSSLKLNKTGEYKEYGNPTTAYKYAKSLLGKYRKIYTDCNIVIREIPIS